MIDSITTNENSASVSASGSSSTDESGYRSFRAQSESGTALIDPPLHDAELLLKQNLAGAFAWDVGEVWSRLAANARMQLLEDAGRYTSAYRNTPEVPANSSQPIVMAGHQPTLFHPGVWFKNFALNRIGNDVGAHSVNLVIDNDVASARSIRVPVRDSMDRVRIRSVAYDAGGSGIPYEQAKIRDLRQFDAFERQVSQAISPLVANPLISRLWPHARDAIRRCEIAGCALAQARHALEAELGWNTLEIPLGVAVRGLPFARFVMEMIDDVERFHSVYNRSADHYRAWHGIRSTAHPVPNLAIDGEWYELPLWVYGNDSPVRRAVWVRRCGDQLELSDRTSESQVTVTLPSGDRESAAEVLAECASPEWKLRPRALVTTMFARLILSDLFLHGIGGGKYDQMADRIIAGFFGVKPPAFQVVSATLRLPGQSINPSRSTSISEVQRQIRDTYFQGERWSGSASDAGGGRMKNLSDSKRELIESMPERGSRGGWHKQIESINTEMARLLEPERIRLTAELDRLRRQMSEESVLASREWSFCLFDLDELVSSFREMV